MPPVDALTATGPRGGAPAARAAADAAATVRVLLFAAYRDAAGAAELTRALAGPDGAPSTVGALWADLVRDHPALAAVPPAAAVNAALTRFEHVLAAGDEVAFLPPVSGG
ncbi:MAG: MoaD/ThiS family protein [Anaerolineae bacterium]